MGVARRVLPGFGPALGFTVTYLSLLVLIPLAGVFLRSSSMWQRAALLAAALLLIKPDVVTDVAGLVLLIIVILAQRVRPGPVAEERVAVEKVDS